MYRRIVKRFFDLLVLVSFAPVILTLMAVTALISSAIYGKKIFFTQHRIGLHGKPFKLWKFKSILHKYNNGKSEQHINAWGRILRRWSLDELPQVINILRGDMSWVGPRPLLPEYLDYYSPEENKRHRVLPGITGLAQVSNRSTQNWDQKLAWDIEYVDSVDFKQDMKILMRTFGKISQGGNPMKSLIDYRTVGKVVELELIKDH